MHRIQKSALTTLLALGVAACSMESAEDHQVDQRLTDGEQTDEQTSDDGNIDEMYTETYVEIHPDGTTTTRIGSISRRQQIALLEGRISASDVNTKDVTLFARGFVCDLAQQSGSGIFQIWDKPNYQGNTACFVGSGGANLKDFVRESTCGSSMPSKWFGPNIYSSPLGCINDMNATNKVKSLKSGPRYGRFMAYAAGQFYYPLYWAPRQNFPNITLSGSFPQITELIVLD